MARILVVEDERSILQLVCEVLVEAGHQVTSAGNGSEAIRQIEEAGVPDLVVLDMWMPVMNGWQFAEALRERAIALPIVVMTAAREARQRAQEVGAIGYIGKPFDVDQFTETVERAMRASDSTGDDSEASTVDRQVLVPTQRPSLLVRLQNLLRTVQNLFETAKDRRAPQVCSS